MERFAPHREKHCEERGVDGGINMWKVPTVFRKR